MAQITPKEKEGIDQAETTLRPIQPPSSSSTTLRKIAIGVLSLTALWTLLSHLGTYTSPCTSTPADSAYLDGVTSKGYRSAWNNGHHSHHSHHDKHKHPHHRKPHIITPHKAEEIYLTVPNNQTSHDTLKWLTSDPHPAGSGFDKISAVTLKSEWEKALGVPLSGANEYVYESGSAESQERIRGSKKLEVWVDTYYPVLNFPVHASVTLLTPTPFHAKLREDIVQGDSSTERRDDVPVFHGLSISGDVKAQYVYVGYGRKSDFDLLAEKGIDIAGKIAIVKYGANFRGLKIKAAQEAGAVGVIIYSDPGDDGEITQENGYEPYPVGPARQPSSVQRGSVQFISKYPGDPSTPGEPAYKNATRVPGGNSPSIPSLPMSYEDVIPILQALQGKGQQAGSISKDWVGGLGYHGVEYWSGPSEVELHLVNEVNTRVTPIWNVAATIPGHIEDEVVIVGNHRDAWVFGGADPNSGSTAQVELVRGLGKLIASGWKPLRTIILLSVDAEEYGLIGSTEFAEDFGDWLKVNTAAYVNLDTAVSGSNYHASASPSLAWLFRHAAEEVRSTHLDDASSTSTIDSAEVVENGLAPSDPDWTGVSPLGSGSDYTAFLQRYGIASGDFGYNRGSKDPVYHYHSVYDTFAWQERYSDPGFHKHVEIAKILGLITLRLADSLVLPINTTQYTIELKYYLANVKKIAQSQNVSLDLEPLSSSIQSSIAASQSLDAQTTKVLARLEKLLPKHSHRHSAKWSKREHHDDHDEDTQDGQKGLVGQMELWNGHPTSSKAFEPSHPKIPHLKEIKKLLKEIREINKKKQGFESGFITVDGIKDREWYKHKGVAPGLWLGYGATTFPALTEALTIDKSVELAQKEADELTELISAIAKRLQA